jgi:hypothetical protein
MGIYDIIGFVILGVFILGVVAFGVLVDISS